MVQWVELSAFPGETCSIQGQVTKIPQAAPQGRKRKKINSGPFLPHPHQLTGAADPVWCSPHPTSACAPEGGMGSGLCLPPSASPCPDQSVQFIFPPLPPALRSRSHSSAAVSQTARSQPVCMYVCWMRELATQNGLYSSPSSPHLHPSDLLSSMLYFTNHPQQSSTWEGGKKRMGGQGPGKVRFRIDKGLGQEGCLQPNPGRKFSLLLPKPKPLPLFITTIIPVSLTLPEEMPNPERTEERTAVLPQPSSLSAHSGRTIPDAKEMSFCLL